MTETKNYNLNQWDAADPVRREDFNSDNAILDAALLGHDAALSSHALALARRGNCKIVAGTYTGTGSFGSDRPNSLDFGGRPILVMIFQPFNGYCALMGNPAQYGLWFSVPGQASIALTWRSTGVTWFSSQASTQMNELNGFDYSYFALLAADE